MNKILFTDLDGTLLDDKKDISNKNMDSINKMLDEGNRLVICTGRPIMSTMPIIKKLDLHKEGCYAVTYNGGMIYDIYNEKPVLEHKVSFEYVRYLFDEAEKAGIQVQTYSDKYIVAQKEMSGLLYYSQKSKIEYKIVNDVVEYLEKEPYKVILIEIDNLNKLEKFRADHELWEKGKMISMMSEARYLEYCPLKAQKGEAIKFMCELWDIPLSNTVACGDGENDISMIGAAGIGIAMSNGINEIKTVSDYVTRNDNNNSAISEIIEKFIL